MKTGLMRKLQHTWKLTSGSFVAFAVANAALTVLATVPLLAQFEINPDHYEFRDAEPFPSQEMSRKPVLPDMTPVLSSSIRWTSLPTGDRFSPMERGGQARLTGRDHFCLELLALPFLHYCGTHFGRAF